MSSIFFALAAGSALAVIASLLLGVTVMAKGGEANKKHGNKLMRARIMLQGAAIVFFILAIISVDQ